MRAMSKYYLLSVLILFLLIGSSCSHLPSLREPLPPSKEDLPQRSWFIDMGKFLTSSHGRFSCSECHSDIEEKGVKHPDPNLLGRVSTLLLITRNVKNVTPKNTEGILRGSMPRPSWRGRRMRPPVAIAMSPIMRYPVDPTLNWGGG